MELLIEEVEFHEFIFLSAFYCYFVLTHEEGHFLIWLTLGNVLGINYLHFEIQNSQAKPISVSDFIEYVLHKSQ